MEVAGGQHLGQALPGLVGREADVAEAGRRLLEGREPRAATVDHEHQLRPILQPAGRGDQQVERLGEADVAGVQHDHLLGRDAELAAEGGVPGQGPDELGVDEVGDHADVAPVLGADLGRDVGPEVVGEHGDRRGAGVARALQPAGGADEAGVGELPELDGDVGEHVLDVEDQRAAVDDGRGRRHQPERERGRHGQHGVHAPSGERGHARQGREGGERGRAHGHARLSDGKGWTRVIVPHSVVSRRTGRPRQPSSTAWCVYHGSAVTTCSSWPRSASSTTMRVMTSPVGAGSGAKWGQRTTSFMGPEGRAESGGRRPAAIGRSAYRASAPR